ncbi:hypothetical protein BC831DRAFT_457631 [Entophlyctis helioformis]|nr:hypothetical protein BC831DRAFT_457631 [Entophlyctis helioformis]
MRRARTSFPRVNCPDKNCALVTPPRPSMPCIRSKKQCLTCSPSNHLYMWYLGGSGASRSRSSRSSMRAPITISPACRAPTVNEYTFANVSSTIRRRVHFFGVFLASLPSTLMLFESLDNKAWISRQPLISSTAGRLVVVAAGRLVVVAAGDFRTFSPMAATRVMNRTVMMRPIFSSFKRSARRERNTAYITYTRLEPVGILLRASRPDFVLLALLSFLASAFSAAFASFFLSAFNCFSVSWRGASA